MTEQQAIASQFRGARAMTRLKVAELARRAGVAPNTVVRLEGGKAVNRGSLAAVREALEAAGVEFVEHGVRLKSSVSDDSMEARLERVMRLSRELASLPVLMEGSPEELLGYDEAGLPT